MEQHRGNPDPERQKFHKSETISFILFLMSTCPGVTVVKLRKVRKGPLPE